MPVAVSCPKCGFSGTARDAFARKVVKCPKCGERFQVGPASDIPASVAVSVPQGPEPAVEVPQLPGYRGTDTPCIRFACPTCRTTLRAPDGCSGKKTTCPKCGQRVQVPPVPDQTVMGELLSPEIPSAPPPGSLPVRSGFVAKQTISSDVLHLDPSDCDGEPILLPDQPEVEAHEDPGSPIILDEPPPVAESCYSRPPEYPRRTSATGSVVAWAILGALVMTGLGLTSSQYFPVFGESRLKFFSRPWDERRLLLIPMHLFVFSIVGAFFGGAIGFVHSLQASSSATRRRSPGLLGLWLVMLLFLAGGGAAVFYVFQESGTSIEVPGIGKVGAKGLTDEQKVAWKKKRREVQGKNAATFQVVGRRAGKNRAWQGYREYEEPALRSFCKWSDGFPTDHDQTGARALAQKLASDPEVGVVVVVDLYSGEDPRPVQFFRDDGSGIKTFSKAPTDEIEKGLRAYFLELQSSLAPEWHFHSN